MPIFQSGNPEIIRLNSNDNVFILARGGKKGEAFEVGDISVTLARDIPAGHKAASTRIPQGTSVVKYGHSIGAATSDIAPGDWVHEHNTATLLRPDELPAWNPSSRARDIAQSVPGTFDGFPRPAGRPGIRNDLWLIPAVGCINGELRALVRDYKKPEWIDAVRVLEHPYGCSQLGGDLEATADLLAGLARNPNSAGTLLVGLGCENLQMEMLLERIPDKSLIRSIILQEEPDERLSASLDELAASAPRRRRPFAVSELTVAVKCGGSDGYSGITANPLLGRFSDRLVASGGTVLQTEIPEMFGAEEVLAERMPGKKVYEDFIALDRWFRDYFVRHGQPIFENPSPGNRAGGITTLEEKSLGAVEKSGNAPITRILKYGEPASPEGGVQIAFAPGNDLVSCTSLAASGAHLVLFTTGRGTPFGTVVPTLKVSTNSDLAGRHPGWIDFDAGTLLTGESWKDALQRLSDFVLSVANGQKTANERKNIGDIAIFRDGVIL